MRANFLLCDYAEVLNGKLYLMGAGWAKFVLTPERRTLNISVAGLIHVPWDQTNQRTTLELALHDPDGLLVENQDGKKVFFKSPFEIGRPPGTLKGAELDVPFAFRFEQLMLREGRFEFQLSIDNEVLYQNAFDVIEYDPTTV